MVQVYLNANEADVRKYGILCCVPLQPILLSKNLVFCCIFLLLLLLLNIYVVSIFQMICPETNQYTFLLSKQKFVRLAFFFSSQMPIELQQGTCKYNKSTYNHICYFLGFSYIFLCNSIKAKARQRDSGTLPFKSIVISNWCRI